jgi:hypothetical protein
MKLCNWEQFKRSGKYSLYKILEERLTHYHRLGNVTPGLQSSLRRKLFLRQLVDSIRRVDYAVRLSEGRFSADVADPLCLAFHPLKAAIYHHQKDDFDEACWLVFLFTHFGKNSKTNWRILRDVYSGFPDGPLWTWSRCLST